MLGYHSLADVKSSSTKIADLTSLKMLKVYLKKTRTRSSLCRESKSHFPRKTRVLLANSSITLNFTFRLSEIPHYEISLKIDCSSPPPCSRIHPSNLYRQPAIVSLDCKPLLSYKAPAYTSVHISVQRIGCK